MVCKSLHYIFKIKKNYLSLINMIITNESHENIFLHLRPSCMSFFDDDKIIILLLQSIVNGVKFHY
jgi:hypothetical protein